MGDAPAGGALDELSMLRASKAVVTAMISAPTSSTIFLASMMKFASLNRTSCARAPVYSRKLVNISFAKQPKRRERDGYAIGDLRLAQPPGHAMVHDGHDGDDRSEEHTSELQSLMRISYAVLCLKNKK